MHMTYEDDYDKKSFYRKVVDILTVIRKLPPGSRRQTKEALNEILIADGVKCQQRNHMDEVYPGIYVGDEVAAMTVGALKKCGITHILNCSYVTEVTALTPRLSSTSEYYQIRSFPCEFLGIPAMDLHGFKIKKFFDQSANFIESALNDNGKVLVHCYMGISRSATIVMAHLMIKKDMSATEALCQLRSARVVHPNDSFLDQICQLDLKLRKTRSKRRFKS